MTRNATTTLDLPSLHRSTVGFDRLFDELGRQFANSTTSGYPPYNVIQLSEDEYQVSLAVAGFRMEDLSITKEKNVLRIEGMSPKEADDEGDQYTRYLHRGIAARNFTREFTIADHVEVVDATLELGMLHIHLKREVPEEYRPKKISISNGNTKTLGNETE